MSEEVEILLGICVLICLVIAICMPSLSVISFILLGTLNGIEHLQYFDNYFWPSSICVVVLSAILGAICLFLSSEEKNAEYYSLFFSTNLFLSVIFPCMFILTASDLGDMKMTVSMLKLTLYSIFVFVLLFGLSSYFFREILPWKRESPVFNTILSVVVSALLSSVAALSVYQSSSTMGAMDSITGQFSDFVAIAVNILFIFIGVFLFWKKIKAYIWPRV